VNTRMVTWLLSPKRGTYRTLIVRAGRDDKHRIEITESPTGRSVQVHVNGKQVEL
jgi:hypothetical protein